MFDGWQAVNSLPPLGESETQIWRITLPRIFDADHIYRQHLSQSEVDRAARLRAGQVRMQFLVARACLRVLTGNVLAIPSKEVPISLGTYGKPQISGRTARQLHFNVAHSRETILIALCRASAVGVDVEYLDRDTEILEVAKSAFTEVELREIERQDIAGRQRAFFGCWTRKEAVVKADGRGLSLPLNSFEVPVSAPAHSAPVHLEDGAIWFVSDLALGEEAAGSVAVNVPQLQQRTFILPISAILDSCPNT